MSGDIGATDPRAVLKDVPLLTWLPEALRALVVDAFVPAAYSFGVSIVREGDPADALYVVVSGRARVVRTAENGEELSLNVLRAGDVFGEIGLLEHTTRTATVRAAGDVEVLRLDKALFEALVNRHPELRTHIELQARHRHLHNFLRQFTAFASLPDAALRCLMTELEPLEAPKGELIVRQGDAAGAMYIVEDGQLRVYTEDGGPRRYVAYLRKGDFFGERSLFQQVPRAASVEALGPVRLLTLTRATFDSLCKAHPDFAARIQERVAQYDYERVARVPLGFDRELLPADSGGNDKVGAVETDYTREYPVQSAAEVASPAEATPGTPTAPQADTPFVSPDGHFVKRARRIRRFRMVRQVDEMDCGAACLAMVCRHFGRSVSLARIRQLVHTSLDGTSLKAIVRAATELGLAARSVKASPQHLSQMPLPAIAHWEGNHWVVLYDVDQKSVKFADPSFGLVRVPRAEFEKKWTGYAALFDYTDAFERAPTGGPVGAAWLWPFLRPYSRLLLQAAALAVFVSALQMVLPVFSQIIVDRVLVEQDSALLRLLIIGMVAVLVFMTVGMVVQRYLLSFVTVRVDSSTLDYLTRRLLALPMSYFNTRRTGDIQRRLAGLREVREFVVQNGVAGLTALAQLGATVTLMFVYSRVLTLAFLATLPLYAGLMYFSARWLRPMYDRLEEAFGRYHSYQIDAIKGIGTVKALGAEGSFRELMLDQFNSVARRRFRADFITMSFDGTVQMVGFLSIIVFLAVGARLVMQGEMTIGALVAFNTLVALANAPIVFLLTLWDNLQLAAVLLNRLDDIFAQDPEQGVDRSRLVPVRTLEGRITLRDLEFRFGGPEAAPVLEGITFEATPGQMVAIVGRSGSGKTTLIKCLAGLLEPTGGTIRFDGADLKTLNYRDLRRKIGFVLQENHLFDDTIARNIAFGEQEPDMDAVLWASRVANAHDFIERLPLGYDTRVGESGISVSGGQRQRIAIARAVYHRPPVLIFDEATSALDTESERAVKENLDSLLEGRTSFVIAHRLSTVRDADLVLVLEQGRLVERGTHDELMERQGLYYYLCSQQLEM
ncbi:MAG: peptidase domain-containing ABC transporter [Gemmatimonadales bacterium]|nr:peptidase domain-containing ABC transporter [Gemmatimonadales bacterium]